MIQVASPDRLHLCDDGARLGRQGAAPVSLGALSCHQCLDSHEVVRGCGESEQPGDIVAPSMPKFVQQANGLHPAKWLLDPLSFALTEGITLMTRRALVNAAVLTLCNMGREPYLPATINKVTHIVAFVRADRLPGPNRLLGQQLYRLLPFMVKLRFAHRGTDHQAIAILAHDRTQVA